MYSELVHGRSRMTIDPRTRLRCGGGALFGASFVRWVGLSGSLSRVTRCSFAVLTPFRLETFFFDNFTCS